MIRLAWLFVCLLLAAPGKAQDTPELPPGHPPVAGESGQPEGPTDRDDPSLPTGTVIVEVVNADGLPQAGVTVTLGSVQQSVAKGESRSRVQATTNEKGQALFENQSAGQSVAYRPSAMFSNRSFSAMPFRMPPTGGHRSALRVFQTSGNIEDTDIRMLAAYSVTIQEDRLAIEQFIRVFNLGKVAWVAGDSVARLPAGYVAFSREQSMMEAQIEEVQGQGYRILGMIKPGTVDFNFRYHVPLSGAERERLDLGLPPNVAHAIVEFEAGKGMGLLAAGFSEAQRVMGIQQRPVLRAERQFAKGDGSSSTLEIQITGLPTPGLTRWVAVGLALALVLLAITLGRNATGTAALQALRADLGHARDALLTDLEALDSGKHSKDIGPKASARLRRTLLDALARVIERMDAIDTAAKR